MIKQQFWEGLVVIALGAGILILAPSQIRGFIEPDLRVPPSFIPNLAGMGLLVVGILLSITSFFGKTKKEGKEETVKLKDIKNIGITILVLFAYAFLFPVIGFLTTSMLFIVILSIILGQRNLLKLLILMILIPALVWGLFELIFAIPLPRGWLF